MDKKDKLYEYGDKHVTEAEAKKIIDDKVKELEKKPPAPEVGLDGIDRWTNNGHGLVNVKPAITKAEAAAIEKAASKAKIKEITYTEPDSYFNEDMRKEADAWDNKHKK